MFAWAFSLLVLASCSSAPRLSIPVFEKDQFIGTLTVKRSFGHFIDASALSFDQFGDLYVTDGGGNGLYKFNRKGDSLAAVVAQGHDHGQFDRPLGVDASLTNSVAVADRNNYRIEVFSRDLIYQSTIEGHAPGSQIQFGYPSAVCRSTTGYYYVIDGERHRLIAFNPATGVQRAFTTVADEHHYELFPRDIALDAGEYVAVADVNSGGIKLFNSTGSTVKEVRYRPASEARITVSDNDLVAFDHVANTVRLFDFRELTYAGSYSLPQELKNAVTVVKRDDELYVLTKDKVVVCSIHSASDLN